VKKGKEEESPRRPSVDRIDSLPFAIQQRHRRGKKKKKFEKEEGGERDALTPLSLYPFSPCPHTPEGGKGEEDRGKGEKGNRHSCACCALELPI